MENKTEMSAVARQFREFFSSFFPKGFADAKYFDWERGCKQKAHDEWSEQLNENAFRALLEAEKFGEVAARAVRIRFQISIAPVRRIL